jgi:hypothetical protein
MSASANFRPVGAALLMLAVLAGAYESARWPPQPPPTTALASQHTTATGRADHFGMAVADSAVTAASYAPLPAAKADEVAAPLPPPSAPEPAPAASEEVEPRPRRCPPQPLRFTERSRPCPRRYVGTVNGQPATAEISRGETGLLEGRFYFWRSGQEYELYQRARRLPRVLTLGQAAGHWQLSQPAGPVLRGTWLNSAGRRAGTFWLRESYQSGARYDIHTLRLTGGLAISPNSCDVPEVDQDFLHLRGPVGQLLQARALFPAPNSRRQQVRAAHNNETHCGSEVVVLLNDFHLLSYEVQNYDWPFEGSSSFSRQQVLLDLTTGRELSIYKQLRPGYARRRRWLLTMNLLDAPDASAYTIDPFQGWEWVIDHGRRLPLAPLPADPASSNTAAYSFCTLTAQGLAVYSSREPITSISYAELRPLVRPGTPLARMLRARGL